MNRAKVVAVKTGPALLFIGIPRFTLPMLWRGTPPKASLAACISHSAQRPIASIASRVAHRLLLAKTVTGGMKASTGVCMNTSSYRLAQQPYYHIRKIARFGLDSDMLQPRTTAASG